MKKNDKSNHVSKRSGFTLIEVILVVVIIGILAGIAIPRMGGKTEKAKIAAGRSTVQALGMAIQEYEMMNGEYPGSLDALLDESKGGPFMEKKSIPLDPWGNPFAYAVPGARNTHSFDLSSSGHEEDVNNWE